MNTTQVSQVDNDNLMDWWPASNCSRNCWAPRQVATLSILSVVIWSPSQEQTRLKPAASNQDNADQMASSAPTEQLCSNEDFQIYFAAFLPSMIKISSSPRISYSVLGESKPSNIQRFPEHFPCQLS